MEPCVRGFSYMPEVKVEVMDLQYIEGGELERTWKVNRRQRLKEQEQKIWEEFVKEQDIVKVAVTEDPYQFLHQLPENCLQEMMEDELQKMRKEAPVEVTVEPANQGEGDHPTEKRALHTVTFADDDKGDCVFHIFDDDNDLNDETSGPEEEALAESPGSGPSTVRERGLSPPTQTQEPAAAKSSENVTGMIESSINCARVKDLRMKIHDQMLELMTSLEGQGQGVLSLERAELGRRCRRSGQFCARFNRIYMYQLQRQMHDIRRAQSASLPFALHTHFQSQMLRVVSLHQNLLQAFQLFHKSLEQTSCLGESVTLLGTLAQQCRDVTALCRALPTPIDFPAAHNLYTHELSETCDKLDEAVKEYSARVADCIVAADCTYDNDSTMHSTKSKSINKSGKKGRSMQSTKLATRSCSAKESEARLSMYSLETLRLNLSGRPAAAGPSNGSKLRPRGPEGAGSNRLARGKSPNTLKLSPRSRRPLMRAPMSGHVRPQLQRDSEVATMVEGVHTCASSHMSREMSPRTPCAPRQRDRRDYTPRSSQGTTPLQSSRLSPKSKINDIPKQPQNKKSLNSNRSDTPNTSLNKVIPVTKIQCAKKEFEKEKNFAKCAKESNLNNFNKDSHRSKDTIVIMNNGVGTIPTNENNHGVNENLNDYKSNIGNNLDKEGGNTDKDCTKEYTEGNVDTDMKSTPRKNEERDSDRSERERNRASSAAPARCEVTRLLRQLCSGESSGSKNERVTGAKNAQLFCMSGTPSRQPSTPQLLRILEETIQKKAPKPMYQKPAKDPERYRLAFNIPEKTADKLFQYRTKFVQHMLTSPMYANSAVGKPWEMIGSISEKIIEELLLSCAKEMEIKHVLRELYNCETR